jgi:hypothetical protein
VIQRQFRAPLAEQILASGAADGDVVRDGELTINVWRVKAAAW